MQDVASKLPCSTTVIGIENGRHNPLAVRFPTFVSTCFEYHTVDASLRVLTEHFFQVAKKHFFAAKGATIRAIRDHQTDQLPSASPK